MNTKELKFAYKVRHVLNESIENLPHSTTEQLASARKIALSRKKKDSLRLTFALQRLLAGEIGSFSNEPLTWLARMGLAVPLMVLIVGLIGIYQFEQERRIRDTAEMDIAVLSDELPLSAYLDHGFNAYLATQGD